MKRCEICSVCSVFATRLQAEVMKKEKMGQRMYVDKIFESVTISGIADYLLFGLGPDEDDWSYEE